MEQVSNTGTLENEQEQKCEDCFSRIIKEPCYLGPVRGGIKKTGFFFGKMPKGRGGGGSRQIQNFLIRKKLDIFAQKGREIFGHILPKRGGFCQKKNENFLEFSVERGGSLD